MRWLPIIVVSMLAIVVQTSIVPLLAIRGARPDVVLVVVVFWAWHLPYPPAVAMGLAMGVVAGMLSAEPVGLFAALYLLVALAAYRLREFLFLRHTLTQIIVTGLFAMLAAIVFSAWVAWQYHEPGRSASVSGTLLAGAAYTALVAPFVHRPLLRAGRLLGIPAPRYRYSR